MSNFTGGIIGNYCRYAKVMCTYCNNLGYCELSGYCVYKKLPCDTEQLYQVSTKELPDEIIINGVKYIKEAKE